MEAHLGHLEAMSGRLFVKYWKKKRLVLVIENFVTEKNAFQSKADHPRTECTDTLL